jgi:hypothetical protein
MPDEPSDDLTGLGVDSFPHLRTMDWNIGIDFKAQFHVCALNTKHRDFQQAMEDIGPSNHHRFSILPR